MRLFPRLAAVFGIAGAALLLPASPVAQQKKAAEGVTTTYLHIVEGNYTLLQKLESIGPVPSTSKLELIAFTARGHKKGDKLEEDEITGNYDDLRKEYDAAWHNRGNNCWTLLEGKSTTVESVLGFNVVVLGPRREEVTQAARAHIEAYKARRPDLALTVTTCPPLPSVAATKKAPELPVAEKAKQLPATLSIK